MQIAGILFFVTVVAAGVVVVLLVYRPSTRKRDDAQGKPSDKWFLDAVQDYLRQEGLEQRYNVLLEHMTSERYRVTVIRRVGMKTVYQGEFRNVDPHEYLETALASVGSRIRTDMLNIRREARTGNPPVL